MYRAIIELDEEKIRSFPISKQLAYVMQDEEYHKEGSVLNHLILTLKEADKIAKREKLSPEDREILMLSAFLHDVGKLKDKQEGVKHEVWSYRMAENILHSLGYHDKERIETIKKLVLYHQVIRWIKSKTKSNKILSSLTPKERYLLTLLVEADCKGRIAKEYTCLRLLEKLKERVKALEEAQSLIEKIQVEALILESQGVKPCDIRTFITEPIVEMIESYEKGEMDEIEFLDKLKKGYEKVKEAFSKTPTGKLYKKAKEKAKEKIEHSKERFEQALKGDWTPLITFKLPPDAKPKVNYIQKGDKIYVSISDGWITHNTKPIELKRGQAAVILRLPMRLKIGDYIKKPSLKVGAEFVSLLNIWNPLGQFDRYRKYKHKISKEHYDNFLKLVRVIFKEFPPFKDAWAWTIDGGYKIDPAATYVNASIYIPIVIDLPITSDEVEQAKKLVKANVSEMLSKRSGRDIQALAKSIKQQQLTERGLGVIDALNNKDYYAKMIAQGLTKAASMGLISSSLATSLLSIANPILTGVAVLQITGEVVKAFAGNFEILRNEEPSVIDVVINPIQKKQTQTTKLTLTPSTQQQQEEKREPLISTQREQKLELRQQKKVSALVFLFPVVLLVVFFLAYYLLSKRAKPTIANKPKPA